MKTERQILLELLQLHNVYSLSDNPDRRALAVELRRIMEPTPVSESPAGVFRNGDRVRIDGVDTDLQGATATVESEDGQSVIVDLDKGFRTVVHHTFLTRLIKEGDKVKVVSHSDSWMIGKTGIVETVYDDGSITVTFAGQSHPFNDASQLELVE